MLAFAVWAINDSIFPYFLKRIVNTVQTYQGIPAGIYAAVVSSLLLVMIFCCVSEFFMRVQGMLQIYTFPQFRANIRAAVFNHVKSHSHEYFSNNFAGNIAKKLADLPTSCQTIMEIVYFQLITIGTGTILVLAMMWVTHPLFAIILIIWLCIHLSIIAFFFDGQIS